MVYITGSLQGKAFLGEQATPYPDRRIDLLRLQLDFSKETFCLTKSYCFSSIHLNSSILSF